MPSQFNIITSESHDNMMEVQQIINLSNFEKTILMSYCKAKDKKRVGHQPCYIYIYIPVNIYINVSNRVVG